MAFEKRWTQVLVQPLISNGTADGQLQVADAFLVKVKQSLLLTSGTQPTIQVQVKRVLNEHTILVGRRDEDIDDRVDVSAYLVVDGSAISNPDPNQPRVKIAPEDLSRAVYDEEPTVALRTVIVNRGGEYLGSDPDSPFYVQLTDGSVNIGTVHAQLEMFLSHKDNDPDAGDVHSSLRIGDGVDELEINSDGSINVVVAGSVSAAIESTYNEVAAVPSATPVTLVTYTAPMGKTSYLHKVFVSGDNIATYKIKINDVTIETVRTYFGGALNASADFSDPGKGKLLTVGDVVTVVVEHQRPFVADFNGRIQSVEV